jgi:hypothetical protein
MDNMSSEIGLIVIVGLYINIGVMAAAGSVYIARSIFAEKNEQIFFGLFLIPIAGFYLAFTAYFGHKDAWLLEEWWWRCSQSWAYWEPGFHLLL